MILPEQNSHAAQAADDDADGPVQVVRGTLPTPVGPLLVTTTDRAVIKLNWLATAPGSPEEKAATPIERVLHPRDEILAEALAQLRAYFAGTLTTFDLPYELNGVSRVARTVLDTLDQTVLYGEAVTYGELAERSGTGIPARAIGGVMGSNHIPILIPCHRVVASNGLGGYSGGEKGKELDTKRWLLEFEGNLQQSLF